jgi:23S rRNA A2030 N6-methylase RlmJ
VKRSEDGWNTASQRRPTPAHSSVVVLNHSHDANHDWARHVEHQERCTKRMKMNDEKEKVVHFTQLDSAALLACKLT